VKQLGHFNVHYSVIIVSKFRLVLTFSCFPFFSLYIIYFRLYYLGYYNSNHILGFFLCGYALAIYILCNIIFINRRFIYALRFKFVFMHFAESSNLCFLEKLEGTDCSSRFSTQANIVVLLTFVYNGDIIF